MDLVQASDIQMKRREFVAGLTAATAFAGLTPTGAAAEGKRVALVIGNGAYSNVPTLPNPPNDAGDVAAALKRLGFSVSLLTNARFDDMRRGLIALGREAAGADMATVYFDQWRKLADPDRRRTEAGHGCGKRSHQPAER